LFLSSRRLIQNRQNVLAKTLQEPDEKKEGLPTNSKAFRDEGEKAVQAATRAYSIARRPEFQRQACLAQVLYGETADPENCRASGQGVDMAEGLLWQGLYWLRRAQRLPDGAGRRDSWSKAVQAFNLSASTASDNQQIAGIHPAMPSLVTLKPLVLYGQRYVLFCNGIKDTEKAEQQEREFYELVGIPLKCGGDPM
jgi:hypothetical protein